MWYTYLYDLRCNKICPHQLPINMTVDMFVHNIYVTMWKHIHVITTLFIETVIDRSRDAMRYRTRYNQDKWISISIKSTWVLLACIRSNLHVRCKMLNYISSCVILMFYETREDWFLVMRIFKEWVQCVRIIFEFLWLSCEINIYKYVILFIVHSILYYSMPTWAWSRTMAQVMLFYMSWTSHGSHGNK